MASRDQIVDHCNRLLEIDAYPDALPVGLQVPGASEVRRIVSGVSATLELFEHAARSDAQMVLVHHGMFWGSGPHPPIDQRMKARLKALFDADISLVAYHLALDAHPVVGNNAVICRLLGLNQLEPFAQHGPRTIGFIGHLDASLPLAELVERTHRTISPDPLVLDEGPERVQRIAVVSGGAAGEIVPAADAGCDCFVTGELKETALHDARESGINVIAAGHHRTEVFGVQALGDEIAESFGIEHQFVDIPNPI
jgi:dinuclear metal center YbgI/SA1388 family protein